MMFRQEYHCFVAGLPELLLDEGKLAATLVDFKDELRHELNPSDYKKIHTLFLPFDNVNLIRFVHGKESEMDPLGNYSADQFHQQVENLDAIIPAPDILEPYMVRFIKHWKTEGVDILSENPENILTSGYFEATIGESGFLADWLQFDLNIRNILTALICRKYQLDISKQLVGKGTIVSQLEKNPTRDFGLAAEIDYIDKIIQISEIPDMMEREKKLDLMRWEFIEDRTFFNYFDIDKILAYLLKMIIALRWLRLDKAEGTRIFRDMLKSMEQSYHFPDEFKRKK